MSPNELRVANLRALVYQAQSDGRDPVKAVYAHLPPVPNGHSFQDYATYVGLGNPMSLVMSPYDVALRDAMNRKYAVYKGASPRDPTVRYQNFDQTTEVIPNAVANTGMSMLDTLASIGSVASTVTPLGGNLRDWAESGDIRRSLNEMYQTSLGRLDRERQTYPKGRAELKARDAEVSFLGQLALDAVTLPRAIARHAGTLLTEGYKYAQKLSTAQNAADVVNAEVALMGTPDRQPSGLLESFRDLDNTKPTALRTPYSGL